MKYCRITGASLRLALLSLAAGMCCHFAGAESINLHSRLSPLVEGYMERASLMLDNGNFAGVIDQLRHINTSTPDLSPQEQQDYAYMLALALYERGDADCVDILREFADKYPASIQALPARLAAADYFFFAHHFNNALAAYDDIDFSLINPADRPVYDYRKALSMTKCGLFAEARPIFEKIAGNRRLSLASKYYLAYLDYVGGDYQKALRGFREVAEADEDNPQEGMSPLHYIAQIEYSQEAYDKVVADGLRLLDEEGDAGLIPETERIVGLSYFKLGDFGKARTYLDRYVSHENVSPADDAIYALGVIDYSDGDLKGARSRFASLTDLNNDLAQSAYLYLGQIAVRQDDPDAAAVSFEKAYRMSYDNDVTEVALYNYISALTHGGNIPFSSSLPLLTDFLRRFPNSEYAPEVREYLATAYFNEKDYARALESINKIPDPSGSVLDAKQKILYELGMEAMANNKPEHAYKYLSDATSIKGNAALRAQAHLWLGDACYALGDYKGAERNYSLYLRQDPRGENNTLAKYNLAYARLMQDKYDDAAESFAASLKSDPLLPDRLYQDALIRMADAQYYSGNYRIALQNYSTAIANDAADSDYATYRRAVIYGLDGDINKKVSELSGMPGRFPDSRWLPDALLELGQTYSALGDTGKAVATYGQLRSNYQQTAPARKGMLALALTYMQAKDIDNAENTYKEIIRKWPTSEEATLANDDLVKIYSVHGGLQEYTAFLNSIPGAPSIDLSDIEEIAFEGAETAFAEDSSRTGMLENYIKDYPDGRFLAQALLDVATGKDEAGQGDVALVYLDELLEKRPDSRQVPEALLLKAGILEDKGTLDAAREATETYRLLEQRGGTEYAAEAYSGIMRNTDNDAERIRYASLVKNAGGISADHVEEAEYHEASARLRNGDEKAADTLSRLSRNPKSLHGAKAAVTLGQYYLDKGNLKQAEKILAAFTDEGSSHQYWLARGFIALADVYQKNGKDYLAIEYLKSLRDNYPGKELDIHDMISSRLDKWK